MLIIGVKKIFYRHCEERSNLMLRDDYLENEIASFLAMTAAVEQR